jgi:hypothetical protein
MATIKKAPKKTSPVKRAPKAAAQKPVSPTDLMKNMVSSAQVASAHLPTPGILGLNIGMGQFQRHPLVPVPPLSDLSMMIAALSAPAKKPKKGAKLVTVMNLVLDESGSMDKGCQQTMQGYNQQLQVLAPSADEIGCRVSQINFNNHARLIANDVQVKDLVPLSHANYNPSGGTALFDTVAGVIKKILSHPLAFDDNTSILLSITTDGDDQGSSVWRTHHMEEFKALMRAVAENDRWTVALAGPDTKLREFADLMCVDSQNVAAFKPESIQSRKDMSDSSIMAMSSYTSLRSSGMKKMDTLYAGTIAGASAQAILSEPTHAAKVK